MIDKRKVESGGFIVLLGAVTAGLVLVVSSFLVALLWAVLAAIMFHSLHVRLLERWPGRHSTAAAMTLLIITFAVIFPAMLLGSMVVEQATGVYAQMASGEIDFALYFKQIHDALPQRVQEMLGNAGLGTFEMARTRIAEALSASASMITQRALAIGANAAAFVLAFGAGLYVTFFLLRDGHVLGPTVIRALPLEHSVARRLAERFVMAVRATIKGSVVVALVQGLLGAITFAIVGLPAALLWGTLMAVAALLPAIGPAIVWAPVAVYLFATGAVWQGAVVVGSGVMVIGLADNILRPMLVGRDTGIPDWLVLLTTLGGIELLGLSGIVVGPVAGALFITGWQIMTEQRLAAPPA